MRSLYIVRHCKAEGQAAEAQLTEQGLAQAKELAEFLSAMSIGHIVSSPYKRAVQSITPFADKLGIDIRLDHRLTERVLSDGSIPEWREMLRKTYDDFDLIYEGGESSRAAMNRAVAAAEDVLEGSCANAAIVTHGNIMSLLLKHYDHRIGFKE